MFRIQAEGELGAVFVFRLSDEGTTTRVLDLSRLTSIG